MSVRQNLPTEQFRQVVLQPRGGGKGPARGHATGGREHSCDRDSHTRSHADTLSTHMLTLVTLTLTSTHSPHSRSHARSETVAVPPRGSTAVPSASGLAAVQTPGPWAGAGSPARSTATGRHTLACSSARQAPRTNTAREGRRGVPAAARSGPPAATPRAGRRQRPRPPRAAAGGAPWPDGATGSAPTTSCGRRSLTCRRDEQTALQVPSP